MIKIIKAALILLYAIMIGYISLLDNSAPIQPVPDLKSFDIENLDKILHFIAYGIFACLVLMISQSRRAILLYCLIVIAYGGILEYLQSTIHLREASLPDFVANTLGVFVGGAMMFLYLSQIKKPNQLRSSQ